MPARGGTSNRRSAIRPSCVLNLGPGVSDLPRRVAPLVIDGGVLTGDGKPALMASGLKRAAGNAAGDMLADAALSLSLGCCAILKVCVLLLALAVASVASVVPLPLPCK